MHATALEIEHLVQLVLERLRVAAAQGATASADNSADKSADNSAARAPGSTEIENSNKESKPGELTVTESVISVETLRERLEGVQSIIASNRAVITPAAHDLLRKRNIRVLRGARRTETSSAVIGNSTHSSILVCGSATWLSILPKQIDERLATVSVCEDAVARSLIDRHLDASGQRAVWVTPTPYAAISSFSMASHISAIHLPTLNEFAQAMLETHAQLIVISSKAWTLAALGNLIRTWSRSS